MTPAVMRAAGAAALSFVCCVADVSACSILFVGNSFTYGAGSAVKQYGAQRVTDLNGSGIGGVPALFKSFTVESQLAYDVYLETHPGVGLDWHLEHEREVLTQKPWDQVVLQSHSLLDPAKPGDPALLVTSVGEFAAALTAVNPRVILRLTATWSRADQTYAAGGAWYGKPIEAMARDVRAGYDLAAAGTPAVKSVIGVGDAWVRAIHTNVADANPYDGIDAGKIDLWTADHYHASVYGYYLEALMLFGGITGRSPLALGDAECSGHELGMTTAQVAALEKVAADQLMADGVALRAVGTGRRAAAQRCGASLKDDTMRAASGSA